MGRKIGEIFELDGEWYQCIESDSCGECSFFITECGSGTKSDLADKIAGLCSKVRRIDSKHAIFKKLEKVGEPYTHYCPSGRIIYFQRYKIFNKSYSHNTEYIMCDFNEDGIVSIEIEQTKEDMEEKKLKLKPFNLEKAKQGKPVCTRGGRKVRIICFDLQSIENTPIVAAVQVTDKQEGIAYYYEDGRQFVDGISKLDLMMLPEKKEGWVNIYRSQIYNTLEKAKEAYKRTYNDNNYLKTIKIEWEE